MKVSVLSGYYIWIACVLQGDTSLWFWSISFFNPDFAEQHMQTARTLDLCSGSSPALLPSRAFLPSRALGCRGRTPFSSQLWLVSGHMNQPCPICNSCSLRLSSLLPNFLSQLGLRRFGAGFGGAGSSLTTATPQMELVLQQGSAPPEQTLRFTVISSGSMLCWAPLSLLKVSQAYLEDKKLS